MADNLHEVSAYVASCTLIMIGTAVEISLIENVVENGENVE